VELCWNQEVHACFYLWLLAVKEKTSIGRTRAALVSFFNSMKVRASVAHIIAPHSMHAQKENLFVVDGVYML
jgi:hypothetical protein